MNEKYAQWPGNIAFIPEKDDIYENADLLIASDCATYGYGMHKDEFDQDMVPIIGCYKLDENHFHEKLLRILQNNHIKSITILRIDLYCCEGIENAVRQTLSFYGKPLPLRLFTVSMEGEIRQIREE